MPYSTLQDVIDDIDLYIITNGNNRISGSLLNTVLNGLGQFVSQSLISSSYAISSSFSTTASHAINVSFNTGSFTRTSSFNSFTSSYNTVSASISSDSASFSLNIFNASSSINNIIKTTGSFAVTGSNIFRGNQTITGSVYISGSGSFTGRVSGQNAVSSNEYITLAQVSSSNNFYGAPTVLNDSSSIIFDVSTNPYLSKDSIVTLGGNRILVMSNIPTGSRGSFITLQDSTGSRGLIVPSNSKIAQGFGSSLSLYLTAGTGSRDISYWWFDGTYINWTGISTDLA